MKVRWFPLEKIVVLLCFLQNVLDLTPVNLLTAIIVVGTLSWRAEKARAYTPLIILLVLTNALRAVTAWFALRIVEVLIEAVLLYLFVVFRVFELPERFNLYMRNAQGQILNNVGYAQHIEDGLDLAIYYPTTDNTESKPAANWYPHWNYTKSLYESVHIDPRKKRILPLWVMQFCTSYLRTYKQKAYLQTTLQQHEQYKVLLVSHGLAANKNMMSCYATWYASRGWIVVCVAHLHDEIRVDFRHHIPNEDNIKEYLYNRRNISLRTRNKQFIRLFSEVEKGLLGKIFQRKIEIGEVMLFGHSFGGTTVLSSGSRLVSHPLYKKVNRYVCLDPWLFPLSEQCYRQLHKPILFLNTDRFVRTNPQFYQLHPKKHRFSKINQLLTKLYIRHSDHLHHSDAIYVFGTLLKAIGAIQNFRYSTFFNEITVYAMFLFERGKQGTELIDELNAEIEKVRSNEPKFIVEDNKVNWAD